MIAIVGPTASGKTGFAIELAKRLNGEIVGVDASQVYRGMDIGTGKATSAELGDIRHHLIDVVAPDAPFDARSFALAAENAVKGIETRGRLAILCGGTGFYLRSFLDGLCDAPPVASHIRDELKELVEKGGAQALHRELSVVDAKTAERLNPNDQQRLERALGVYRTTGRPLSDWHNESPAGEPRDVAVFGIRWERALLNERIEARVDMMLEQGWVEEVKALRGAGYDEALRSMAAIGYRVLASYLDGEITLRDARSKIIVATRRYAKRQMTWFRGESRVQWLDAPLEMESAIDAVTKCFLRKGS